MKIKPFHYGRTLSAYIQNDDGEIIAIFHGKTKVGLLNDAVKKIKEYGINPTHLPEVFWAKLQLQLGRRGCEEFPKYKK